MFTSVVYSDLNNGILSRMQKGELADAIEDCRYGLGILRQRLKDFEHGIDEDEERSITWTCGSFSVPVFDATDGSGNIWESGHNLFTFYPKAISVSGVLTSELDHSIALVCLLYNMALCQHKLHGYQRKGFTRTAPLYKAALNIISSSWPAQLVEDNLNLLLALCANLGHVYCHHGFYNETREYINILRSLLSPPSSCSKDVCFAYNRLPHDDFMAFHESALTFFDDDQVLTISPAA